MLASFVNRIRSETEVGVPRRFSIGTLFVLLTLYGVLFRLLVLLGTDAKWTGVTCLLFATVTVGQMLLFRGVKPRAASIVTGAIACPAMLVGVAIDEMLTQWIGWEPLNGGLNRPGAFFAAMLLLAMIGSALGYLVGGTMASVFYVIGKVRPSSGVAGLEAVNKSREESHVSRLAALCVARIGRWINPIQPREPLRGALAAFLIPVVLGFLISPFVMWAVPYHVMMFSAGLGALLALWSGNFQLWFFWPMILCSVGAIAATWPAAVLREVPMFEDIFREKPEILRLIVRTLGILIGLTVSALGGWTQWMMYRRHKKGHLGVIPLGGFVVLLVSLGLLATDRLSAWVQSPQQQLFKKIRADGGYVVWNSLGQTLYLINLMENSGDDEFLKLRPLLLNPFGVQLIGKGFTDRSVNALEGLHITGLTLTNTSITDAAFDELTDFSASWVYLQTNNVGDQGVAALTAIPQMQKVLEALTLDYTKITDDGLLQLQTCRSLTVLSLSQCEISDDGLKTLARAVPNLRQLFLVGTNTSDEGLAHLAKAKNLTDLRVKDTNVTQAGVDNRLLLD